jgi:hypothetical protein
MPFCGLKNGDGDDVSPHKDSSPWSVTQLIAIRRSSFDHTDHLQDLSDLSDTSGAVPTRINMPFMQAAHVLRVLQTVERVSAVE